MTPSSWNSDALPLARWLLMMSSLFGTRSVNTVQTAIRCTLQQSTSGWHTFLCCLRIYSSCKIYSSPQISGRRRNLTPLGSFASSIKLVSRSSNKCFVTFTSTFITFKIVLIPRIEISVGVGQGWYGRVVLHQLPTRLSGTPSIVVWIIHRFSKIARY